MINPLPEGNAGLANQYIGDVGLASDSQVLFFDDFESYGSTSDLWGSYENFYQRQNFSLETQQGDVFAGRQSLEILLPNTTQAQYNSLTKEIAPTDTLFVRFYTKLEDGFSFTTGNAVHDGISIKASYDGAGVYPNGRNHFYVGLENTVYRGEPQPGYTHGYVYHMDQRSGWGDHWYSDGVVIPGGTQGNFGPDFIPRPNHLPETGEWYSVELMVQANSAGARDGRVAAWIDGELIADWQNIRFRSTDALKIDQFDVNLGAQSNTDGADRQWFDNVVAATSYIGPMSSNGTTPTPTPGPNAAPDARDDAGLSTDYGTPVVIALSDMLANDTDANGDILTVTGVRNAVNGSVTMNSDPVFTPTEGFSGTASFTYDISDGKGGTDSAVVTIDVLSAEEPNPDPNVAPDARDDAGFSTTSDKALVIAKGDLLANDSDPDGDALSISGVFGAQGGSVSLTSGGDVRFSPNSSFDGTARFTYSVSDGNGGTDQAQVSIAVSAPPLPEPESGAIIDLWSDDMMPDIISDSDRGAVQLGLKFQSSVDGTVTGIQFYKGPQNDGDNLVRLWSANGDMVASGTFEDDGSTGWQTVYFDQPVAIKAGEVWTASYHAPQGGYSVSEYYFDGPWTNGPLTALEDGGVYAYGSADVNPTQSYHASNYWIDVLVDVESGSTGGPVISPPVSGSAIGEAGIVENAQSGPDQWHLVTFDSALDDPVVVMGGFTGNGSDPYTVKVRNVTDTGFEYQIDEWDYLDGRHARESISWLAIESGDHTLSDGRVISAGKANVGGNAAKISFGNDAFDSAPVVLGQSSGNLNAMAVTDRISDVSSSGFSARLYQQEKLVGDILSEDFNWIAVENGGSADNGSLAGTTGRSVTHKTATVDFTGSFPTDDFAFLTDMQSINGSDPATVQIVSQAAGSVGLRVLEEGSADSETNHVGEQVGYAGFELGIIYGDDLVLA